MKGMNLSGNPGIVQPMQMPPTLGQPPIPEIQPRFRHIALHHRAPAADLNEAFGGPIFLREIGLLVIGGAIATIMHNVAEQLSRAAKIVHRDHRREPGELAQ
jgi:hypothetical protein